MNRTVFLKRVVSGRGRLTSSLKRVVSSRGRLTSSSSCLLLLAIVTSLPSNTFADPPAAGTVQKLGEKEGEKDPARDEQADEKKADEKRPGFDDVLGRPWRRRRSREPGKYEKNYAAVLAAFRAAVAEVKESTVLIYRDDERIALGAVVDADGLLVSKASELEDGGLECEFESGMRLPAEVVWVDPENDLAFLRVPATGLKPIVWRDDSNLPVGSWLVTPGPADDPIAIGVVSVATRKIDRVRRPSNAYLGVVTVKVDDGLIIKQVMDGTSAFKAELKVDDIIIEVAGKPVDSRNTLLDVLYPLKPGDGLKLRVRRGDEKLDFDVRLGRRPSNLRPRNDRLAGALSTRRSDFPSALQHDTMLHPRQCGGPVLDVYGKAVGINIARAGRVECYAIPVDVILPLIDDVRSGKHLVPAVAAAPAIDTRLVAELEKAVENLSGALKLGREPARLQKELVELNERIERIRGIATAVGKSILEAESVLERAGWEKTPSGFRKPKRRKF